MEFIRRIILGENGRKIVEFFLGKGEIELVGKRFLSFLCLIFIDCVKENIFGIFLILLWKMDFVGLYG